MKNLIKKNKIFIFAILTYLIVFIFNKDLFLESILIALGFMKEMLQVLPPVLVISALITVWVPGEVIRKGLGVNSGFKGRVLSFLVGSISAGPIYAAFPAVLVLFKKGASVSNMVIILSSWAVIKIPMLLVETSFLGVRFTLLRLLLTIPAILIMGILTQKLVKRDSIILNGNIDSSVNLPNLNCGRCGFKSCADLELSIKNNNNTLDDCLLLKKS